MNIQSFTNQAPTAWEGNGVLMLPLETEDARMHAL